MQVMTTMADTSPRTEAKAATLFVSDAQLAAVLGIGEDKARTIFRTLERDGFPARDPIFGRRYFPAVRAFLDRRAGLGVHSAPLPLAPDGPENWGDDDAN